MPTMPESTNIFVADTDIVASDMNTNFSELVTFVNTNLISADGAKAMTAALSLVGADPTSDNHAARKSYVDDEIGDITKFVKPINNAYQGPHAGAGAVPTDIQLAIVFGSHVGPSGYGVQLVVFNKAFSNGLLCVVCQNGDWLAGNRQLLGQSGYSLTGFTAHWNVDGTHRCDYIAIGW